GMHLVIATQRPSADVITGLMKSNIPSRIAFAVSSGLESRIILDQMGAEKLIGTGDMLFSPLGVGKPERIQGVFVSDEERERVISFIKDRSQANYSEDISAQIEEAGKEKEDEKGSGAEFSEYDELLKDAAVVVIEAKQASVSMLQRRLKLGYSRAARIVDQLEDLGIVGGFEGSKPREVKMTMSEWLEFIGEENGSDDLIIEDEELDEDF
ncbi:MAG: DNA translocase FtsK, partial [Clostridiales bacterium]|nr:DNA translocase FtsK [Clostridiales bacterium]